MRMQVCRQWLFEMLGGWQASDGWRQALYENGSVLTCDLSVATRGICMNAPQQAQCPTHAGGLWIAVHFVVQPGWSFSRCNFSVRKSGRTISLQNGSRNVAHAIQVSCF